ncbi:Similar to Single-stranded TG1-3 DNA-binding protein; acc. no. Q9HEQ9 [Pyronema omphalodes CBS 100304]|uniref:Similar to Single-stranded TG1-3 DNA-binding protein acc. no. Q9HEQ9 n=1 Tax=Pyronema omphalodes (strain CBS 100304) TaxID=1076935 RepID=U4KVQ3_PYROM|nr:Similar to Single-stranded TG1-3 DNA-binding protein; acc. no. Q9HEQ9 [Pyronema omphalodes CBS 100304]
MSANAETVSATVESTVEKAQAAASATVEALTEAVKNTSIKTETKDTSEADAAHAASAAEGRRLYIGNLAYSTTDEQLKEFFSGFSIESTSIPTNPRTGRAVGYAFVDLTTKEDADRAIAELSGKEVQERKVSVQLARKPGSTPSAKKEASTEEAPAAEGENQQGQNKRGRGGFRGRGRGRAARGGAKRNSNRAEGSGDDEKATPTNVPGQALPLVESTNVKAESSDAAQADANTAGFKGQAQKKKRGPPENGVPSSTKIMVANLPYELSEEKLKELFAAYQPESAKIALRPIPRYMVRKLQARGEPRKGRGFGFVNLSSEDMQKKAVEEMNGKVVEGREIAVKVAIDTTDSEDKENEEKEKAEEAQTSVNAEPATVAAPATATA